jgi:hypothetical protein
MQHFHRRASAASIDLRIFMVFSVDHVDTRRNPQHQPLKYHSQKAEPIGQSKIRARSSSCDDRW